MEIYVVAAVYSANETEDNIGCFSTLEKAKEFIEKHKEKIKDRGYCCVDYYDIECFVLDSEKGEIFMKEEK